MGSSVFVNKQGWSHKGSGAVATNTDPDVCKTKSGGSIVTVSYSNTALSSDLANGAKTVKVEGEMPAIDGCCYSKSTGDEAGNRKGVISKTNKDKAEFANYSFDVKCEGKGIGRNADLMFHNNRNTMGMNRDSSAEPPASELQTEKGTIYIRVVEHLSWENYDEKSCRFRIGHEDNNPVAGQKLKIKMSDGGIREETTNDDGVIEIKDQDPHGRFEIIYEAEDEKINQKFSLFHHGLVPWEKEQES